MRRISVSIVPLALLAWLVVNLAQAGLTPLDPDETYYWFYAQRLSWGYFDHPPAVAALVRLGSEWPGGSLGLRLGHVLLGAGTLVLCFRLMRSRVGNDPALATVLLLAQPMLQVYGFIATPDGPLLFCTALYLLVYRRFLDNPSLGLGALWGVSMAALLYSKYHGAVLILFSCLPNFGYLIRRPGAWLAVVGGAALYLPHLAWQYANDFPSFRYHLSGRDDAYRFSFTLQYVANQLLVFSPLLVYHYVMTFVRDRAHDRFERTCRWLVGGILLFFLYTTTKGRTEAQWTALLSVPLVYLTYRAVGRHPEWRPPVMRLGLVTICLLLVARLLLMLPREWVPFEKPFDHAPWVAELAEIAGDRPVIVQNSYRLASLYEFYSGRPAWTFTGVDYRRSEYDLRDGDTAYHNQKVILLGQANWRDERARPFRTQKRDMLWRPLSIQIMDVRIEVDGLADTLATSTPALHLRVRPEQTLRLNDDELPIDLYLILRRGERLEYRKLRPLMADTLPAGRFTELYDGPVTLPEDLSDGPVEVSFGLGYRGMTPLRAQSDAVTVIKLTESSPPVYPKPSAPR